MKLGPPFQAGADPVYANLPAVTPGAGANGVLYVGNQGTDPTPVQPWVAGTPYMDDEFCHDYPAFGGMANAPVGTRCATVPGGAWYTNTASTAPFAGTNAALSYKWVRLTLKENNSVPNHAVDGAGAAATQICYDGTNEFLLAAVDCPSTVGAVAPPEPVYMLTALAVSNSGARRIVQSEVAKVLIPPPPAALTFAGPGAVFGAPNSNPYHIQGNDAAGPPPAGGCVVPDDKPAIAAYDPNSVNAISGAIPNNRTGHYTGTPPVGQPATTPQVSNLGPTGSNQLGPYGNVNTLNQLVTDIEQQAKQTVPAGKSTLPLNTLGSLPNDPLITVVKGDITFSGTTRGAGILLVEGTLTLSGNSGFDGIVLVIGSGVPNWNVGGNGAFN